MSILDRRDGKRVKELDGMHGLMPHLKPKRCDSDVYINTKIDVTNLVKYIEKKKKEDRDFKLTYFHAFVTAMAKMVYNRPLLNRFIINKKFYDRNCVKISFVAKTAFTDEAEENLMVVSIEKDDNIETVGNKISGFVKATRSNKKNNADAFINTAGKMPKFIKAIIIGLLRFFDNHDLLPESLTNDSVYHSTILVSNLGSIGCGAIYHNLTDFGTNSILATIGEIKKEPVITEDKKTVFKDFVEIGVNLDERIADGFYFVKALKMFEYVLNNPELLEGKANDTINIEKDKKSR